jgi:hypothetical protein
MITNMLPAIDEWAEFFAYKYPSDILSFSPSAKVAERIEKLVFQEKTKGITLAEKEELDKYMILEHIMRIAKAKAKSKIRLATA